MLENFSRCTTDLDRYVYIMSVQADNERLFYRVIELNIELMMPIIYTPVVGAACQAFSRVYRRTQSVLVPFSPIYHRTR